MTFYRYLQTLYQADNRQIAFYIYKLKHIPIKFTMYTYPVSSQRIAPCQQSRRSSYYILCDGKQLMDSGQLNSQTSIYTNQMCIENKMKTPQKTNCSKQSFDHYALIQQNKTPKKQLTSYKCQSGQLTADSSRHETQRSRTLSFNCKQLTKKQAQQLKQLKIQNEMLKKQCQQYQDIINKMQEKINQLQYNNKNLVVQIKNYKVDRQDRQNQLQLQKLQLMASFASKQKQHNQTIKMLKDKTNKVVELIGKFQTDANQSQMQWTIWKDRWEREKLKYVQKIASLEDIIRSMKNIETKKFINYKQAKTQQYKPYVQIQTDRDRNTRSIQETKKKISKNSSSYNSYNKAEYKQKY